MSKQKTNKKLPKTAVEEIETEYPYCFVTRDTNGGAKIVYRNPLKPYESFETTVNPDGSYKTKQISDSFKGMETSLTHEARSYVSGGSSSQIDGNADINIESTRNENIAGDSGTGIGGVNYEGAKKLVLGTQEGSFDGAAGGNQWRTVDGDYTESIEGSINSTVKGDRTETTIGCSVEMTQGDKGIFVTGGSMALTSATGNINIWSLDKLFTTSDLEIQVKINNSPAMIKMNAAEVSITGPSEAVKITMSPSKITVKAPALDFDVTGAVNIKGGSINFTKA